MIKEIERRIAKFREIERHISEFKEMEHQAMEAKDYPACMYLHRVIIHIERFLEEMRDKCE